MIEQKLQTDYGDYYIFEDGTGVFVSNTTGEICVGFKDTQEHANYKIEYEVLK